MERFLTQTWLVWFKLKVDAKACLVNPVSLDDLVHLLLVPRLVLHELDVGIQAGTRGLAVRVFREDCSSYICEALACNWTANVFNLKAKKLLIPYHNDLWGQN